MAKQPQSCAFRTSIGGQALIEGILMRGPEKQAIVVRDQEGNLVEKVEELRLIKDRHPILGWPLIDRHGGRHRRHRLYRPRHGAGGPMRAEVLPGFLGGVQEPGR